MGVTLERVQFKFASIIGELCSEPDILSQFAVWVDLRLAEYKLKGSISLDCSGDTPDPVWLNGILSALVAKRMAKMDSQKQRASTSSPRSNRVTGLGRNFSERSNDADDDSLILTVSPEPVVKSEPVDSDVYPINLIEGSGENSWSRKRQSSDYSMSSPSLHKSRRLHSSSDVGMSESLMSIIGTDQEDSLQNPADHTSVTAYSDDNSSNADYMMAADISQSAQREIDRLTAQGHVSTASNIESKPGTSESTSASGQGNRTSSASTQSWRLRLNPSHRGPRTPEEVEAAKHRKAMLKRRSCVSKLERWLLIAHNETRPVETIPPEELDSLLAEFFTTLKTVRGTEYGYDSLITLRSELEQHLKHRGYPHLIRASALFARSQEAVKRRRLHQSESHLISTPQSSSSLLDEHHRTEGQLSIHIQDMTCESVQ